MSVNQKDLLWQVEQRATQRTNVPEFRVGDTVDVGVKIIEGEKARVQIFNGTVIARRGGGLREYFTVRRIVDGEGVERDFPIHSPAIAEIKVKRHGESRRAKLFYLRDRIGKATRLREKIEEEQQVAAAAETGKKGKKRGKGAKAERKARAAAAAEAAQKARAEKNAQAGKGAGKKAEAAEAKSE